MPTSATYDPTVFDVTSQREAMAIILTPEDDGHTTDHRWEVETPYLAELIQEQLRLTPDSLLLDYGCGIGRLSRALISHTGCSVVGVDISSTMRTLSSRYVDHERFTAMSPGMLTNLVLERDLKFDAAIAVWVLQHIPEVEGCMRLIHAAAGGNLFVLNERGRCIPTDKGWVDDSKDTVGLLQAQFGRVASAGSLPPSIAADGTRGRTFWARYGA